MIEITSGTTLPISLTAPNRDLTGATFSTELKGLKGSRTIPNSQHAADPDQVTNKGKYTITFTADDYTAIGYGVGKEIVTKITQSAKDDFVRGHVLTILSPHPDA